MIALLGTQPLVVNYHSRVLDGVAGRLGLTPPGMKEFTCSPSEGMLRRFMNDLECSIKVDDSGKPMGWSIQEGLHTEYSSNFMQRNRGEIHCVFHDNLLSNLIKDLDALCLSEPASPPHPRGRLDPEQLIKQFKEMGVEGRKTLFSTLVDCAKGFLTAEDRDEMANLIRPDPTPLPPVTSTATLVVTTIGDTPLNAVLSTPSHHCSHIITRDNCCISGHCCHHSRYDIHTYCGCNDSHYSGNFRCTCQCHASRRHSQLCTTDCNPSRGSDRSHHNCDS